MMLIAEIEVRNSHIVDQKELDFNKEFESHLQIKFKASGEERLYNIRIYPYEYEHEGLEDEDDEIIEKVKITPEEQQILKDSSAKMIPRIAVLLKGKLYEGKVIKIPDELSSITLRGVFFSDYSEDSLDYSIFGRFCNEHFKYENAVITDWKIVDKVFNEQTDLL